MKFHWDLTQAEPIIRDEVVVGSSDILKGAAVGREGAITTAENRMGLQNVTATDCIGMVGVAQELYDYSAHYSGLQKPDGPLFSGTNAATAAATGVSNYIKVCINPMAVWQAEWSQHADNDDVNNAASTGGKVITDTMVTDHEGDWLYVTNVGSTAGGAGNLFMIGASGTTATATATTSYDDNMKTTNTSDTYIHIVGPWTAGDTAAETMDLSAAAGEVGTHLKALISSPGTCAILVVQNWIEDKNTSLEPLRVERNSGINYDAATCHLYGDIFFQKNIFIEGGVLVPTIA